MSSTPFRDTPVIKRRGEDFVLKLMATGMIVREIFRLGTLASTEVYTPGTEDYQVALIYILGAPILVTN